MNCLKAFLMMAWDRVAGTRGVGFLGSCSGIRSFTRAELYASVLLDGVQGSIR